MAIAEQNVRGVTEMIHTVATQHPSRPAGAVLADVMDMLHAQDAQDGLGKLTVIVWSEALRNPLLAAQLTAMVTQIRADLAEVIQQRPGNLPAGVPADVLAGTLISLVSGYLLQLAILGPASVDGVPAAVRAVWPGQPG